MAKKKLTPEEQLLNLIEKEEESKAPIPRRRRFSFFRPSNLKKFWFFLPFFKRILRNQLLKLKVSLKEPNLKVFNKVLTSVSVILFIYLITDFSFTRPDIRQFEKRPLAALEPRFKETITDQAHSFLYYLEMVQRRNIFTTLKLQTAEIHKEEAKKVLNTLVQDLALVGISWGKEPQVMIEDKKAKKTYFLKTGEMINELKIETILKDRIILTYDGEEMEFM